MTGRMKAWNFCPRKEKGNERVLSEKKEKAAFVRPGASILNKSLAWPIHKSQSFFPCRTPDNWFFLLTKFDFENLMVLNLNQTIAVDSDKESGTLPIWHAKNENGALLGRFGNNFSVSNQNDR